MWFKNLRIYRFTQDFIMDKETLNAGMNTNLFSPCGSQEASRLGWVSALTPKQTPIDDPLTDKVDIDLVFEQNGYWLITAKKQDKVLPASVINEAIEEKVAEISEAEGRPVRRKERQDLKDDVLMTLLPRAFTRSSFQSAYINQKEGYIVVNAASANKAEELLTLLRESLGSLPVIPIVSKQLPFQMMTSWVGEAASDSNSHENFSLGDECELSDPKETGSVIRCKHQDLASNEINSHLQAGMIISKLGLNWLNGIEFILDDQLAIKRLRFADNIQEKADSYEAQDSDEQFAIEFSVMTLELSSFIKHLTDALGGINTEQQSVEEIVARVDNASNSGPNTGVKDVSFE
jgi:recombination associated protein RdgC